MPNTTAPCADVDKSPVYFWRESDHETGWLSQWYYCPFKDDTNPDIVYKTAEHAKAVLTAGHPPNVKSLGRKVKNFSEPTWNKHRQTIVQQGNDPQIYDNCHRGFRKGTDKNAPMLDGSLRDMLLAPRACRS